MVGEDAIAIVRVGLGAEVDPIAYLSEVKYGGGGGSRTRVRNPCQ